MNNFQRLLESEPAFRPSTGTVRVGKTKYTIVTALSPVPKGMNQQWGLKDTKGGKAILTRIRTPEQYTLTKNGKETKHSKDEVEFNV